MKDNKSPEIASFLDSLAIKSGFAQTRTSALETSSCVFCHEDATEFKDALSKKEFGISGMCQDCQDDLFGDGDYPEEPDFPIDIDPRF